MNLRQYLPTRGERGPFTGALSARKEWHALGVGFLTHYADRRLLAPLVAAGVTGQTDHLPPHARDAAKELGYTALGAMLAEVYARVR